VRRAAQEASIRQPKLPPVSQFLSTAAGDDQAASGASRATGELQHRHHACRHEPAAAAVLDHVPEYYTPDSRWPLVMGCMAAAATAALPVELAA